MLSKTKFCKQVIDKVTDLYSTKVTMHDILKKERLNDYKLASFNKTTIIYLVDGHDYDIYVGDYKADLESMNSKPDKQDKTVQEILEEYKNPFCTKIGLIYRNNHIYNVYKQGEEYKVEVVK